MGKAIGIDLGTTNSVVAFKDVTVRTIQTGANNEDLCRSCVALDKNGNFLVGNSVSLIPQHYYKIFFLST